MEEFNYEIQSLDQLDEFQVFYHKYGLCHVLQAMDSIDAYQCEVLEPCDSEIDIFYLEIGDKIRLS